MDFHYTEEEQSLIGAARSVFSGEVTLGYLRDLASGKREDETIWAQFTELGMIGVMAPGSIGGLGQSRAVMAGIAEAAGYVALPAPLIEMAGLVVPQLLQAGETELARAVIGGTARVGMISPMRPYLPGADYCTQFLIHNPFGYTVLDAAEVTLAPIPSIDPLRRLFRTEIKRGLSTDNTDSADIETEVSDDETLQGAIFAAAQLVGLAHRLLDMAVSYSKDRQQFDQPIGAFQAVKHHVADLYTQIEFTRPLVQLGALAGGRAVHAAAIAAIDTAIQAAETAIQIYGAMGYSYEADIHFFMKRIWALCGEWGGRNYHMRRLETDVFSSDAELGPGASFSIKEIMHG